MSFYSNENRYLVEGEVSKDYWPIMGGVFNIPQRLKEVNPNFFVMYNKRQKTYEIHVKDQVGGTYGCTLPYSELDARAVEYVRKYSAARTEQTVKEIEAHNAKLENEGYKSYLDTAGMKMKEAYRYLDSHESAEEIPKELIEA